MSEPPNMAFHSMPIAQPEEFASDITPDHIVAKLHDRILFDQKYLERRRRRGGKATKTDQRLQEDLVVLAGAAALITQIVQRASEK